MTQRELTQADYIAILKRRWVLITVLAVIGAPLAYGVARVLPNRYKSQTLVLIEPPTVPTDFVKPVITTEINARLASMQEEILSRTRLEPIIHQYGLYSGDVNRVPPDALVARLQRDIEITPIQPMAETRAQELPGFHIIVTLDNPRTAQEVCSAVTHMFIEESIRLRQQRSEDTTQFLAQQLVDAKAKLDEQDSKLAAFKSRYIGSLPDEEQGNLNLLMGLTSQLDAATQALARAQQDKSFAESMLTQQVGAWQASQSGTSPQTMDAQLTLLQTQLANLQARYTDDYPDVVKTKSAIAALQKKIADSDTPKASDGKPGKTASEPAQIAQLRAEVHTTDQVIAEKTREQAKIQQAIKVYQDRVQSSPAVEQQYKELTRDYQTALDFYNELLKKRDQSAMATDLERQQEGEQFKILDPANLPDQPSFPNRPAFALGGLAGGLALGVGLAFVLESRDTSFRTERDVEFALKLPVLAMVPSIEQMLIPKTKQPVIQKSGDAAVEVGARA
ncbi:MAG TPA: GNVR domain-containing protein [Candidatus Acidoferrales bacterium]|nr:GNVR domain-containing protein [Candidatus Acidoferrales bacterium]